MWKQQVGHAPSLFLVPWTLFEVDSNLIHTGKVLSKWSVWADKRFPNTSSVTKIVKRATFRPKWENGALKLLAWLGLDSELVGVFAQKRVLQSCL